jgi:hypothetical protein
MEITKTFRGTILLQYIDPFHTLGGLTVIRNEEAGKFVVPTSVEAIHCWSDPERVDCVEEDLLFEFVVPREV